MADSQHSLPLPPTDPEVVAAADLGSNSFHLVVAEVRGGQLVFVDRRKEFVRLAGGLDERKRLTPEATSRALDCLGRFGERVRSFPPGTVRVVGTST
ncbi:MAG: exopolyphosphatase, partial [Holophagales bacterium]|nr:exopolyphosphatase [Holophagales bacterium]